MKFAHVLKLVILVITTSITAQDILPFPPAPSGSQAGVTIESSTYKKRVEPKRLPADASNILIILVDDVGAATPSTYGGEINTPTLDRVAGPGVSYTSNATFDIGTDQDSPVSLDYYDQAPFTFNGTIGRTTIEYLKK